jgi:hypothetical protein
MQVLLPAALCCSVSFVQAGGLFVTRGPRTRLTAYNPLSTLRLNSRAACFLSVVAVPHTTAGILVVLCLLSVCATWPTSLNVVFVTTLMWRFWTWANPPVSRRSSQLEPLLGSRLVTALTIWTALQVAVIYTFQIPDFSPAADTAAFAWLNIGIFRSLDTPQELLLLAIHVIALASLYLTLIALRCTHDTATREWPSTEDVTSAVEDLVREARKAEEERAAHLAHAAALHKAALASPMVNRLPSMETRGREGSSSWLRPVSEFGIGRQSGMSFPPARGALGSQVGGVGESAPALGASPEGTGMDLESGRISKDGTTDTGLVMEARVTPSHDATGTPQSPSFLGVSFVGESGLHARVVSLHAHLCACHPLAD